MGGREWDRRGGCEVKNPGDKVEASVRGVIGSLRCRHLLDSVPSKEGSARRGLSKIAMRSHVTTVTTPTTRLRGQNEDEKE